MLAEAPTANLFLVRDGVLLTPRLEDGILAGITRATVLRVARSLGWRAEEVGLRPADAYAADEAFLCGTGIEFAEIARFDEHPVSGKSRLLERIIGEYMRLVRGGVS